MFRLNKVVLLILITLCCANYLYAQEGPQLITIYGKVVDKATSKPVVNATVTFGAKGVFEKTLTNKRGVYAIRFNSSARLILGQITISAQEYKDESRIFLIVGNNRAVKVNFTLKDIVKPGLVIYSPKENQEIFTNPVIEVKYQDYGAGVNFASIKIYANSRDVSKYVRIIDAQSAICAIPNRDPLAEGEYKITAQIKDYAGNSSEIIKVSTKVVSKVTYFIRLGKESLLKRDISSAYIYFTRALIASPRNPEANFYCAITRLALLPTKKPVFNMLQLMGFTGTNGTLLTPDNLNPFHLKINPPAGLQRFNLAGSFPEGRTIQKTIEHNIMPEMEKALKNLDLTLADKNFTSYLSMRNPVTGVENIEIDYADAAFLKSIICALKSKMHEMMVRDIDCDIAQLSYLFAAGALNPEYLLQNYPDLMRVKDIPQSLKARKMLILAIDSYIKAFNFLKAETDDQSDDLFSISSGSEYQDEAQRFAKDLLDIRQSLLGKPDSSFSAKFSQFINLGYFYTNPFDLRRLGDADMATYLLKDNFLPPLDYALNNLSRADINYQELFAQNSYFYPMKKRKVDFADVSLFKASLESMRIAILSLSAYNLKINAPDIGLKLSRGERVDFNYILSSHPHLLRLVARKRLYLAREAFDNLVKNYIEGADYLLYRGNERQSDSLFIPQGYVWQNEPKYRAMLIGLNRMGNVLVNPNLETEGDEFHINLAEFFIYHKDIRQFLPQFKENKVVPGSWPDITFGGIAPDNKLE